MRAAQRYQARLIDFGKYQVRLVRHTAPVKQYVVTVAQGYHWARIIYTTKVYEKAAAVIEFVERNEQIVSVFEPEGFAGRHSGRDGE